MRSLTVYTDGGARGNPGPAASAFLVYDENGSVIHQQARCIGRATNNVAEYTAVLDAVSWLVEQQDNTVSAVDNIIVRLDSQLVVEQLSGRFKIKNSVLKQLALQIQRRSMKLPSMRFVHVRRYLNAAADALVNKALDAAAM